MRCWHKLAKPDWGYYERGYLKRKFTSDYNKIFDLRVECLLLSFGLILSLYFKLKLTNIRGIVGNNIFNYINKKDDYNKTDMTQIEILKLGAFFYKYIYYLS